MIDFECNVLTGRVWDKKPLLSGGDRLQSVCRRQNSDESEVGWLGQNAGMQLGFYQSYVGPTPAKSLDAIFAVPSAGWENQRSQIV